MKFNKEYIYKIKNQMFTPNSMFLASYPSYEGEFSLEECRTTYSKKTDSGFLIEWKNRPNIDNNNTLKSQNLTGIYNLDGLCIAFKNFKYSGNSGMYLTFTAGEADDLWDDIDRDFDTHITLELFKNDGKLYLHGGGNAERVLIGENSLLERDNLVGKEIILQFIRNEARGFDINIFVDDRAISFSLDKSIISTKKHFFSMSRVQLATISRDNEFSVEVCGIYANTDEQVTAVMNSIAKMGLDVSLADKEKIEQIYAAYKSLHLKQRRYVINYPTLNMLRQKVRALTVDSDGVDADGFTVPTLDMCAELTRKTQKFISTTKAVWGGWHIDFNCAGFGSRQYFKQRFVAEDITLRFNNYNRASGGLVIGFNTAAGDGPTWNLLGGTGRFGPYLLIYNSAVYITVPHSKKMEIVWADPALSQDNLQNNEFFISFCFDPKTRRFMLYFTIDDKTFSAYSGDLVSLNDYDMDQFNYTKTQIIIQSVGSYNGKCLDDDRCANFSVDLTGIKYDCFSNHEKEKIANIEALIDALPKEVTLDSYEQISNTWNSYFELTKPIVRKAVKNYDKLLDAYNKVVKLKMGASNSIKYIAPLNEYSNINNSKIMPQYIPDDKEEFDELMWPKWAENLIIAECRIETATPEGTFGAMEPIIAHFAELGVNLLWITPFQDRGDDPISPYCNFGPDTICPYITGQLKWGEPYDESKVDYEAGFKVFADFIKMAHSYNVRVVVDIVPWGLSFKAKKIIEHPDWFKGPDPQWGGESYDHTNRELKEWYINSIVELVDKSGCDGIRWDLEPNYFGYDVVKEVVDELRRRGKKPISFSEDANLRNGAYAFEQFGGVTGDNVTAQLVSDVFFKDIDLVKAVKTGQHIGKPQLAGEHKYYTNQMSSHDIYGYHNSSLAGWAYQYLFSSLIPLFFLGEEWCAPTTAMTLNGEKINLADIDSLGMREYYETVKKYFEIRWKYSDILKVLVPNHKDTNICTVDVIGTDLVKAYARFNGNKAIVVVPNVNERSDADCEFTACLKLADMGLGGYSKYTVTDLLCDEIIISETTGDIINITQNIEHGKCAIYLVCGE